MERRNKMILQKKNTEWSYVHDAIIDRVNELYVTCPECENIIHDDEQYQCGTCNGVGSVNVSQWIKDNYTTKKEISLTKFIEREKRLRGEN